MKIKIKHWIVSFIDWINSIPIWEDDKPISNRYSTKYFLYLGDGTLDKYKHRKIAYSGLVSNAPEIYHNTIIDDVNSGRVEDYVIIFDNWK